METISHLGKRSLFEKVSIMGLGGYVPERIVKNAELIHDIPDITEEYIFGVTGIRERRWAAPEEKPSDMAYKAALSAIQNSGIPVKNIDGIIVTTTTPDVAMPSIACILQGMLGIRGALAFDLNAACSGWLYGLSVAKGLIFSEVAHHVLVVGVDMQCRLLDKIDKSTYFLFGDGAGAAIVSSNKNGHIMKEEILIADAKGLHMARRDYPGYLIPGKDAPVDPWVRLDGHAIFRFATESFASLITSTIEKSEWDPGEVRWVIPHQANGRILKAAAQKCGFPFERIFLNIDHVGNTSSASIPLALLEAQPSLHKSDKIILCSVGAGITAAAISLEW
jgi:3-oxoacyl-[acyl-carrier-protein] synthase-3